MLQSVELSTKRFTDYRPLIDPATYNATSALAQQLQGARILHLSSTNKGGGVAEVLKSYVPLLKDLGLRPQWQVLTGDPEFFKITKLIHNGLQGDPTALTLKQWQLYLDYNQKLAAHIDPHQWDFIVVHDPQPASVLSYCSPTTTKWVWRCHIDSRHATPDFINHFVTYLKPYDGIIFTLKKYLIPGLKPKNLAIVPMAIDPLNEKNQPMTAVAARRRVAGFGIDLAKPLVVQVSRFDPWKDPLGVIDAWLLAKRQIPDLQLALVGEGSVDDPEAAIISFEVQKRAKKFKDIFVIVNRASDRDVKAFQTTANVVIQKSLREGFGLTVSEALWASTPVIGGNFGGIPEQVKDGQNGYLVESVEDTAERMVALLNNPARAKQMGEWGHEYVRQHFLLPRLIRDDLRFLTSL